MDDCDKEWQVELSEEAAGDARELAAYYFEVGDGERSAEKFEISLRQTLDSLASFPRINTKWGESDTVRRVDMTTHKVALVYRIEDDTLKVIAVAAFHTLSDPSKYQKLVDSRIASPQ